MLGFVCSPSINGKAVSDTYFARAVDIGILNVLL